MKNRKQGFTLVEIMIVVMIIGLLAAIALPGFARARTSAQENACINNLRQIESAKDQYAIENGQTTGHDVSWSDISGYMKKNPECPINKGVADAGAYELDNVGTQAGCLSNGANHDVNGKL